MAANKTNTQRVFHRGLHLGLAIASLVSLAAICGLLFGADSSGNVAIGLLILILEVGVPLSVILLLLIDVYDKNNIRGTSSVSMKYTYIIIIPAALAHVGLLLRSFNII